MKLVPISDPILFSKLPDFDFSDPPTDPAQLVGELSEFMLQKNGIGLAANQVGLPYRCFVVRANPIIPIFNPRIIDESSETSLLEEGCLSFPGMLVKVKRPIRIRMRFDDVYGNTQTQVYQGMTARIMHHETDHLNGILFTKRASKVHLAMAKGKQKVRI